MRVLAISLVTAVFVATVGLGWLFDQAYRYYFADEPQQNTNAVSAIEEFGKDLSAYLVAQNSDSEQLQMAISNWPTKSNYQLSLLPFTSLSLPPELEKSLVNGEPLTLASEDDLSIYYYLENHNQLLIISSAVLTPNTAESTSQYWFTGLFYLCLLLLMLLWLYPLINRLLALRVAAKAFGQGQLQQRVEVGSVSYIRDLELEFNHMAQRINDLVGDVKLLSSAVSHDLRTPLATIRFGIDTLQEEDDPLLRKKFEQRISDNVDAMIELVEILLNYARLDQSLVALEKEPVEVERLLTQVVANQQQTEVAIVLSNTAEANLKADADRKYLSMLLNNLVKNAVQHCNQQVSITLDCTEYDLFVTVSDDGSGIAESDREQIVKPFVRGNSEHKGYGVGLAIVQRILHWHGGTMEIGQDEHLGGAKFTISIPLR